MKTTCEIEEDEDDSCSAIGEALQLLSRTKDCEPECNNDGDNNKKRQSNGGGSCSMFYGVLKFLFIYYRHRGKRGM